MCDGNDREGPEAVKATIHDSARQHAVRTHDIVAYLRARRWREREYHEGQYAVWERKIDGEAVEILLPLNNAYRDYDTRIAEVLRTLEAVEQRSQLDILFDLRTVTHDVTRISADGEALIDGTISLQGGAQFVACVQRLVLAAASGAVQPRSVYGASFPEAAAAFVQQVRIGIVHGSFTVAVCMPIAAEAQQVRISSQEMSFARRVTLQLIQTLHTLSDAADRARRNETLEPLLEVAPGGVSADLCEALIGLYEGSQAEQIRFSVTWSPLRPPPAGTVSDVTLPAGVVPVLQETVRVLYATAPREDVTVQGFVVRLEPATHASQGRATIHGLFDGAFRSIVCDLAGEDYRRTLHAYERRQMIRCTGDLVREGETYVLRNPHAVAILDTNQD